LSRMSGWRLAAATPDDVRKEDFANRYKALKKFDLFACGATDCRAWSMVGSDNEETLMRLIAAYLVIVFVFGFFGVELGIQVDHLLPSLPTLSLSVALAIFFGVLVAGWPVAVFVTEKWLMGAQPKEIGSK